MNDTKAYRRRCAGRPSIRRAAIRILVLDGAMGTMIQQHKFGEAEFRGARFADWPRDLRGNNDLLSLTQPQTIKAIHLAYFEAGADIVETNTFSSTRIAQADYGMEELVAELNFAAARLARDAADAAQAKDGKRRFVAGALGPTNRTASISPDVNNPGFRAVSFDDLRDGLCRGGSALIEGGADLLIVETIFDTLNAKAALSGIDERFRGTGREPAGDDLRHDHRFVRPHAVRPNAGRVLAFAAPRKTFDDRSQLRAWRPRDARPSRRAVADRRYARLRLSQRRPAERIRSL